MTINNLIELAELHASRLQEDLKLTLNRADFIRVTARLNEAQNIYNSLRKLNGEDAPENYRHRGTDPASEKTIDNSDPANNHTGNI